VLIPLLLVCQLALATAVLEGTGATGSFRTAAVRALRSGQRTRTALLSYALVSTYAVLVYAPVLVLVTLARATNQGLLTVATTPLEGMASFPFLVAVVTVAAADYRIRSEGADLEAALNADWEL
jgi:hypothetical protein